MAAAAMYVTVAGAGLKDGSDWANAFGLSEWETDLEGGSEAGDQYYVEEGTYTLTSDWDALVRNGSGVAPIYIIGVKSGTTNEPPIYTDWATGSARPLIAASTNGFGLGDYWHIHNLRVTTQHANGFKVDAICLVVNCHSNNSSGSAYEAFNAGNYSRFVRCEAQSTNGEGFYAFTGATMVFCYSHDCGTSGFVMAGNTFCLAFCIADTCSTSGFDINARDVGLVMNCTVYNCGEGIDGTTGEANLILNNIIEHDTGQTGIDFTTETDSNYYDHNNVHGNGTSYDGVDTTNVYAKDNNATANDPQFDNAAGGDFALGDNQGSCIDAGLSMSLGVG